MIVILFYSSGLCLFSTNTWTPRNLHIVSLSINDKVLLQIFS